MKRFLQPSLPVAILRMLMGIIFMAHAIARLADYTIPGFGDFLNSKGFPFGFYLAWVVTLFELAGGFCMFLGYFPRLFCIGEIIILLTGIILVHWKNGWFVVGKTLGGIEYSVVLIIVLAVIFLAYSQKKNSSSLMKDGGKACFVYYLAAAYETH
jgi:putative oxidoreductase